MIVVPKLVVSLLGEVAVSDPRVVHVVHTLAARRGLLRNADEFARELGFGSRHQLHRFLKRHRMLPISQLAAWTRVLTLAVEMNESGMSLEDIAWRDGVDPSVEHRRAHRILGVSLRTALQDGVEGVMVRMWQDWARHLAPDRDRVAARRAISRILRDASA